jgi:ketosteroid isomerase-like protein
MAPNNETQIRELIENWTQAVRNKDINGILAHHSPDMVMYDVPEPFKSVGIVEYRRTWYLFFACTKQGVFEVEELHIVTDENVAFCFADMKCSDKSETVEFVELPFRLTIGLKKINAQWTIVHEHHSIPSK